MLNKTSKSFSLLHHQLTYMNNISFDTSLYALPNFSSVIFVVVVVVMAYSRTENENARTNT